MLNRVTLQGFRAFRDVTLELGRVNVLIGPNGAGKSSLVDFLDMLAFLSTGALQRWVATHGRSASLLHFGPKHTPECRWELAVGTDTGVASYGATLAPTHDERLVLAHERIAWQRAGATEEAHEVGSPWAQESGLAAAAAAGDVTAKTILWQLQRYKVFHFHDTSPTSAMRSSSRVGDGRYLRSDGGNLAAVLARLKRDRRRHYERIVTQLRRVVPALDDFLFPDELDDAATVNLSWRHRHHAGDYALGAHQLSDGSLRAIALVTLVLLPDDERPRLVVLDEPELGLHPVATGLLSSLIRAASHTTQFVLATQSGTFLDEFDADQIVVVESKDGASVLRRPDPVEMERRRRDFDDSFSEQWAMNMVGGRP